MKYADLKSDDDRCVHLLRCKLDEFTYNVVDQRGHIMMMDSMRFMALTMNAAYNLDRVVDGKLKVQEALSNTECSACGAWHKMNTVIDFNENVITAEFVNDVEYSHCGEYSKQSVFKFPFQCKSGKLVFANDLRSIPTFRDLVRKADRYDINYKSETIRTVKEYSEGNFLNMICLNQCPAVLQNEQGEVIIGEVLDGYEIVGRICTDLWAVHAIDYDDFKEYEGDFEDEYFIVDVSKLGENLILEYNYNYIKDEQILGKITAATEV